MKQVDEHTAVFQRITQQTFEDMLEISTIESSAVESRQSLDTVKPIIVSIHYTGTVFGEYLLALDEATAANLIGADPEDFVNNRDQIEEEIRDALSEVLNVIVGESIIDLQHSFAKLTFSAPRIFFGRVRYPNFRTGRSVLLTDAGEIECHFCLDLMRLNLAESYDTAMKSLLDINGKLKEANQQLAAQQAQLVHSEKMASIGVLAAGVAHEINTPLFAVDVNLATFDDYVGVLESTVGLYEDLVNSLGKTGEAKPHVDTADDDLTFILQDTKSLLNESRDSTTKIKTIIQNLKELSNLDHTESVPTDINQLLENVIGMMGDKLAGREIEKQLGALPMVDCNPGEIGQVVINLLTNAVDACGASPAPIKIETAAVGPQVVLTVSDQGCGIDQNDLKRVFDPFFTTKEVGSGTGLGLSVSFGIVSKHRGQIEIDSQKGEGTWAKVYLPTESHCELVSS